MYVYIPTRLAYRLIGIRYVYTHGASLKTDREDWGVGMKFAFDQSNYPSNQPSNNKSNQ